LGNSMPIMPYWKMNKSYFDQVEGQVATIWKEYLCVCVCVCVLKCIR
jgi:hypothetical protein